MIINSMNQSNQDPRAASKQGNQKISNARLQQPPPQNEKLEVGNQPKKQTLAQGMKRRRLELIKIKERKRLLSKKCEDKEQEQRRLQEKKKIREEVRRLRMEQQECRQKLLQLIEQRRYGYQQRAIMEQRENTKIEKIGSGNWREKPPKKTGGLIGFIKKSLGFEPKKQQPEPQFDQDFNLLLLASEEDESQT